MRLTFRDILGLNKKTLTQTVISGEITVGMIKWYAHWRRYCFFPNSNCIFDVSCLLEISKHIEGLMSQRKEQTS